MPKYTISSATNAVGGMYRSNEFDGSTTKRTKRNAPAKRPTVTPTIAARLNPITTLLKLTAVSVSNDPSLRECSQAAPVSVGLGTVLFGNHPNAMARCQHATNSKGLSQ